MEQGLALFGPAVFVFGGAVFFDLGKVALKGAPAFDLHGIDGGQAAAAIVAAVPLEPAAVVGAVEPAFAVPGAEGLAAFDLKVVAARVGGARGQGVFFEGAQEPFFGKLQEAVVHVLALKGAEFENLRRGEIGLKVAWDLDGAVLGLQDKGVLALVHAIDAMDGATGLEVAARVCFRAV